MKAIKPHRTRHTYTQSIHATPDAVFPLLCPVRELDWVDGWELDWVISQSGLVEEGCIFQTGEATWVVTHHDPACHRVEMFKLVPGRLLTRLWIELAPDGTSGTHAQVTYEYTALGPAGEQIVEEQTPEAYRKFMLAWEDALNRYLEVAS